MICALRIAGLFILDQQRVTTLHIYNKPTPDNTLHYSTGNGIYTAVTPSEI